MPGFEHRRGLGLAAGLAELAGANGSGLPERPALGKTTLVDLVAGLLAPERGTIDVDGNPLAGELLERWRAGLAYVGQEGNVFNDSVRSNLLADGATADEAALWQALEIVGLAEAGARIRGRPRRERRRPRQPSFWRASDSGWSLPARCSRSRRC